MSPFETFVMSVVTRVYLCPECSRVWFGFALLKKEQWCECRKEVLCVLIILRFILFVIICICVCVVMSM